MLWIFYLADDEDEYDEGGASNRLLGFMFGNVDGAGDLDVDYLDEANLFVHYLYCDSTAHTPTYGDLATFQAHYFIQGIW